MAPIRYFLTTTALLIFATWAIHAYRSSVLDAEFLVYGQSVTVGGTSAGRGSVKDPFPASTTVRQSQNAWRAIVPVAVTGLLALTPAPAGLAQHAWYYFAIFAGVIVALISEPLPGAAVGLIGVAVVTALAPTVLYGPAELAKPGFNQPTRH
jgi:hypothetical protein